MYTFKVIQVPIAVAHLVRALESTGTSKIPIIKAVRLAFGLDLKAAKFLIEDILAGEYVFSNGDTTYYKLYE